MYYRITDHQCLCYKFLTNKFERRLLLPDSSLWSKHSRLSYYFCTIIFIVAKNYSTSICKNYNVGILSSKWKTLIPRLSAILEWWLFSVLSGLSQPCLLGLTENAKVDGQKWLRKLTFHTPAEFMEHCSQHYLQVKTLPFSS